MFPQTKSNSASVRTESVTEDVDFEFPSALRAGDSEENVLGFESCLKHISVVTICEIRYCGSVRAITASPPPQCQGSQGYKNLLLTAIVTGKF